jgi:hypothetical protein
MGKVIHKAVFWDDELEAGEIWFEQIKSHIDKSSQLFVFWCRHASISKEVSREFGYALKKRKRVVPVLLDDTPLAQRLKAIQGVDLRDAINYDRPLKPAVRTTRRNLILTGGLKGSGVGRGSRAGSEDEFEESEDESWDEHVIRVGRSRPSIFRNDGREATVRKFAHFFPSVGRKLS